jgi:hypothetical protein
MRKTIFSATRFLPVLSILFGCGGDPTSTVVTTETWKLSDAANANNYANIAFEKYQDNSIGVKGVWYYGFFGSKITCKLTNGSATVDDTMVTITAQGTASYPEDSSGIADASACLLQMAGVFKAGVAKGTWSVRFSDSTWNDWVNPGNFTGQLQSGGGVTAGTE